MNGDINQILSENSNRHKELNAPYDPIMGIGSHIPRKPFRFSIRDKSIELNLPEAMFKEPLVKDLNNNSIENILHKLNIEATDDAIQDFIQSFNGLRIKYDFEFFTATGVTIFARKEGKEDGTEIKFKLNYAQRKYLLPVIETQRFANRKIRIILVKARQWGGSTMIQIYIFYLQNILMGDRKWNSAIIAHVEKAAKTVRSMFKLVAKRFPAEYGTCTLKSFEGTKDIQITENDTVISVGSMEKPDGVRSDSLKAVHCTEVAMWKATEGKSPEDMIQSINGTLSGVPLSFSAYESTAKGQGNFFHKAWLNSVAGKSDYQPVFVPWFVITEYQKDYRELYTDEAFIRSIDEYEEWLWEMGATLEGIYWYRRKLDGEMEGDTWRMRSEFPTTASEAFQSTGRPVFHPLYIDALELHLGMPFEQGMLEGVAISGPKSIVDIRFIPSNIGKLKIWTRPIPFDVDPILDRYVVSMDIGGASREADKTVITVIDRIWMVEGEGNGEVEVVASLCLNVEQDIAVWMAIQLCVMYNNALFIPEYNSLDTSEDTEGDYSLTILDEIVPHYENIFTRTSPEQVKEGAPATYGFHTNKRTKPMIISNHRALLREGKFIERDEQSIAEHRAFEHKEGGKMGGAGKMHDDYVMSRAIGTWAATSYMDKPRRIILDKNKLNDIRRVHKITGEATI